MPSSMHSSGEPQPHKNTSHHPEEPAEGPGPHFVNTNVLIIGTGISGLFTALKLAESGVQVMLITKNTLEENNSRYAQGGIAAVLPQNAEDSLDLHLKDTLVAGAGLCNQPAAKSILAEAFEAISDLLDYGVPFDKKPTGQLELTLEGGHSVRRIIHAGGDATGQEVELTLLNKVLAHPNIVTQEFYQVRALDRVESGAIRCHAVDLRHQTDWLIDASHVVLATGGLGRLYAQSTNPAGATGDGFALALSLGATLNDMEFVQFHPTALFLEGQTRFLISEALRGEGGILRNSRLEAFAKKYHPSGELAPRDIVTRAIFQEIQTQCHGLESDLDLSLQLPHVWLDMRHLSAALLETRFPTILKLCHGFGVDIRTDLIPVAPAAHYIMGGVSVNDFGETTAPYLYAVGEVAHTGLHGANRLASNSLLECCVLARRVAQRILSSEAKKLPPAFALEQLASDFTPSLFETEQNAPEILKALDTFHTAMWQDAGIVRDGMQLQQLIEKITHWKSHCLQKGWNASLPLGASYWQQLQTAQALVSAALKRENSIGAHFRSDSPTPVYDKTETTSEKSLLCTP
ncbi:MAG: L-aspartate oxidase [Cyanobacteria bacterium]|nr:L-aspartate oxidase [Cyanobacteriota bacterium]